MTDMDYSKTRIFERHTNLETTNKKNAELNGVKNNIELDKFEDYIKNTPLIGEIGLDFHWVEEKYTYPYQIKVFEYFLQCAKKYNKYIMY